MLNIMTISQKRKRMPPKKWACGNRLTGCIPRKNSMVIVSKYELVEKLPGVFRSMCRSGSLSLLWRRDECYW